MTHPKLWYMYIMEYYPAVRKIEVMKFAYKAVDMEIMSISK